MNKTVAPELPSGVNDILLEDAQIKSQVLSSLRAGFQTWGFTEAVTPAFERYETLIGGGLDSASMFTFSGSEGDLLALRPDLTTPIARVVASRLRDVPRPIRLYYQGHVFRRPQDDRRQNVELAQAGIELIGAPGASADAEVVALAIESLERLGMDDYQLNLGHIGVFQGILEAADLNTAAVSTIRRWIDRKDRVALTQCLNEASLDRAVCDRLLALLTLSGGRNILDRAREIMSSSTSLDALDNLEAIVDILEDYGLTDRIVLDLAEVRGLGYYTGLMFEGFSRSAPVRILNGGRYDSLIGRFGLDCPAVGCAFDIGQIRSVVQTNGLVTPSAVDVLVQYPAALRGEAFARARTLRDEGRRVALAVDERPLADVIAYAASRGIGTVLDLSATGERILPVAIGSRDSETIEKETAE